MPLKGASRFIKYCYGFGLERQLSKKRVWKFIRGHFISPA